MANMLVKSYVSLRVPAEERHLKAAREAAECLTTDKTAVTVAVSEENPNMVVTVFPMKRARQMDVADRIMHAFAMDMEDYSDQSVGFPKTDAETRRDQRKLERAKERRRERRDAREAGAKVDRQRDIPRDLVLASRQVEDLIRPMGFDKAQRIQFFVLLQIALIGRIFANLGHASLAKMEADRIYELAHEFGLPKDLFAHDDGFYRGRVYELVRFAELQVSAAMTSVDLVSPQKCTATDVITSLRNLHALLLDCCDGSDLESGFRKAGK